MGATADKDRQEFEDSAASIGMSIEVADREYVSYETDLAWRFWKSLSKAEKNGDVDRGISKKARLLFTTCVISEDRGHAWSVWLFDVCVLVGCRKCGYERGNYLRSKPACKGRDSGFIRLATLAEPTR